MVSSDLTLLLGKLFGKANLIFCIMSDIACNKLKEDGKITGRHASPLSAQASILNIGGEFHPFPVFCKYMPIAIIVDVYRV
jgi:hypothetical protein